MHRYYITEHGIYGEFQIHGWHFGSKGQDKDVTITQRNSFDINNDS